MASDIRLVLDTQHQTLTRFAQRCDRGARGVRDPREDLLRELGAHLVAARDEVYPTARHRLGPCWHDAGLDDLPLQIAEPQITAEEVADAARVLVAAERSLVIPVLVDLLPIPHRRQMGKAFRVRVTVARRATGSGSRRHVRSHTELYEMARRADLPHRSTMTHRELNDAVIAWERSQRHLA